MSQTIMYGIKNCDTIKKARKWLESNGIDYQFHDYRADGVDAQMLETFEAALGWENLLNKRGTTFRQLPEQDKEGIDKAKALSLLEQHPAMIKRPVLVVGEHYQLGFKPDQYQALFNQ